MVDYVNKSKNLKTKLIDSSNKNKCIAYCGKLPFGILSHCRYIDLEKMKIVSCKIEKMNTDFSELNKKNGYCFKVIKSVFIYSAFKKFKRKR